MFSRGPNRGDFSTRVAVRLPSLCLVERPPHPRGDSKPLAIGQLLNLNEFLVRDQHLQTLTHAMSISGACGESIVENWCQPPNLGNLASSPDLVTGTFFFFFFILAD